jgi:signal transduction histidine kinase
VDLIQLSPEDNGLVFDVSSPACGLIVDGDANQLDRVLMNLLSNAVKYTPSGGHITLTAGRRGADAVIEVRDTGIGIPEQEQQALFTRFFRATNAVDRAIQGSGLGLSIVRTIIQNHHGEVELTSREGAGTMVTVRIPLLGDGSRANYTASLDETAGL